mgnify:FL=1
MCAPIGLIVGIASAGLSYIGQRQAAQAQEKAQAQATELEQARYRQQLNAARVQQAQARVATAQRIGAASRANQRAMARAKVAAGEAGVTGLSVQALIDSMTGAFASKRFSETQREGMQDVNRDLAFGDLQIRSQQNLQRINQPINQPNILQSLLTGTQVGLSMQSVANEWDFGGSTPRGADPGVSGNISARPGMASTSTSSPSASSSSFRAPALPVPFGDFNVTNTLDPGFPALPSRPAGLPTGIVIGEPSGDPWWVPADARGNTWSDPDAFDLSIPK